MNKKMVNIRLDSDLWQQAKVAAASTGVTLQTWLTVAIMVSLNREEPTALDAKDDKD